MKIKIEFDSDEEKAELLGALAYSYPGVQLDTEALEKKIATRTLMGLRGRFMSGAIKKAKSEGTKIHSAEFRSKLQKMFSISEKA